MTVLRRFDLNTSLTAVLGPTNTGKTFLAVERMCGHSSGMIGFPLRLLAREVYDRVVAIKGAGQVALITGEEKIVPHGARYFLCTAESMPLDRDVSFVALDEAQMANDDERGHIFTDRLLRSRGRTETMILGSETLKPLIRQLLPGAEIIGRPRFSTLSFTAAKKLSRLPKRTAIVAFSADEVYAIAEMLRRQRGGAAVVMGALSPRTRNAQVAMYQSGEVDYLVATDAIGMGINMDIGHVAFGSLSKFDGKRRRRLSISEMAQIAGRAGRHHRDGTFGVVQTGESARAEFEADEVQAIEAHAFPPLSDLKWRNPDLDFTSVSALVQSLEMRPHRDGFVRTEEVIDLAVLRFLSTDMPLQKQLTDRQLLKRFWAVCQLPDYQKTAVEQHSRLVARFFGHLGIGRMTIPNELIGSEVARLDTVNGDIDTLSGRIAAIRTWTYVAHQNDWLEDPTYWAERTRAIEDRLSDAMHEKLTQRFVDRRTSVLLRKLKGNDAPKVEVSLHGRVDVDGADLGQLNGFTFTADPAANHVEKRLVMAAAERSLVKELQRRALELENDNAAEFSLAFDGTTKPKILWRNESVAEIVASKDFLRPRLILAHGASKLPAAEMARIDGRLHVWLKTEIENHLRPLFDLAAFIELDHLKGGFSAAGRGVAVQLIEAGGCLLRDQVDDLITAITPKDRKLFRIAGIRLGMVHVFSAALLKPKPTCWRMALGQVKSVPTAVRLDLMWRGNTSVPVDLTIPVHFYVRAGYWPAGSKAVRIDMVDRLANEVRELGKKRTAFVAPEKLLSMVGLNRNEFAGLMEAIGYRRRLIKQEVLESGEIKTEACAGFQWKGNLVDHARNKRTGVARNGMATRKPTESTQVVQQIAQSPFSALATLIAGR
jgi:ATP-dependent RNA helicase SUPV3L1/SUV3